MPELNSPVYVQERFLDFGLILPIPILVLASGDFLELLTGVSPSAYKIFRLSSGNFFISAEIVAE